ncbi:hypothetical protein BD414DRAFT_425900 [Trametes punicea]|nr:hypothetical protein BD414DRAFT_425900 [Trametes punicea]
MLPAIPQDVVEAIIDAVWPDQAALRHCALTCRGWLPRSRYNLLYEVMVCTPHMLSRFSRMLDAAPERAELVKDLICMLIHDEVPSSFMQSVCAVLALRLPNLRTFGVTVNVAAPTAASVPLRMAGHMAQFTTVNRLSLYGLQFSSFVDLARMIMALPRLSTIELWRVKWRRLGRIPPDFPLNEPGRLNLKRLAVYGPWDEIPGIWILFRAANPQVLRTFSIDSLASTASDSARFFEILKDFTSLESFTFASQSPARGEALNQLILTLRGLFDSITSPHLKTITLDFVQACYISRQDLLHVAADAASVVETYLTKPTFSNLQVFYVLIPDRAGMESWWKAELEPFFSTLHPSAKLYIELSESLVDGRKSIFWCSHLL